MEIKNCVPQPAHEHWADQGSLVLPPVFPSYLVKEAIDHVQVSRGIGCKDASCAIGARNDKLIVGKVPDCIW